MTNKDRQLMKACVDINTQTLFLDDAKKHFDDDSHSFFIKGPDKLAYPLDSEVIDSINKIIGSMRDEDSDYEIFKYQAELSILWKSLVEKSIKCLRFFDTREPFIEKIAVLGKYRVCPNKRPNAYGIDSLHEYYKKYTEFEKILYGSSQYYRDHIIHVFRTWLSGLECLTKNGGKYIGNIFINGKTDGVKLNNCEKLSIWTIIALTHDLGYPLEKAKNIIDTTKDMVSTFLTNPSISMDLSFHGVQNYMNDFIVRLMSSKMELLNHASNKPGIKKLYYARLQPKYYFKFQKSLEKTEHGIISTLIIYKLLTFFLESDYNINEDYSFNNEERRQFYIRREILRSIASHTCKDIYQLYIGSFAFLLIITDNTQEWGRKYISELYVESGKEYRLEDIVMIIGNNNDSTCKTIEKFTLKEKHKVDSVGALIKRLRKQALDYITIFRDGQDTIKRDFTFIKECNIKYEDNKTIEFDLTLRINNRDQSKFSGTIKYSSEKVINEKFNKKFFEELFPGETTEWSADNDQAKPEAWQSGNVTFPLIH
jgi:hypothetical protein